MTQKKSVTHGQHHETKKGKHEKHKSKKDRKHEHHRKSIAPAINLLDAHDDGVGDGVGELVGKTRLGTIAAPAGSQDYSIHSYNELVSFNEEGHPFIDVDRLIYQPKNEEKGVVGYNPKNNLAEYAPDFTFILLNMLTLGASMYFIMMGTTTMEWESSMSMFSVPNCNEVLNPAKLDEEDPHQTEIRKLENIYYMPCTIFKEFLSEDPDKYNFSEPTTFRIFRTMKKLVYPSTFGKILILIQMINFFNVMVGIRAAMKGYKPILIQHMVVDMIIITTELFVCLILAFTGECDEEELKQVRVLMAHYVQWYGVTTKPPTKLSYKERELNGQVDALQIGLQCCGLDGWGDYLAAGYPHWDRPVEISHLAGVEAVIPFSCCRRWWVRNIYCAVNAHLWASPTATPEESNMFHERISQEGCYYKLEKLCESMKANFGVSGIMVALTHIGLFTVEAYAAVVLIKNIDNMIQVQKKIMKRRELMHETGDSANDLDMPSSGKREGSNPWAKFAPPTEDEISTIKERSNFNKFVTAMKYGRVGKWMEKARRRVTLGQEDLEVEPQTAVEKKAREKELLHGPKAKKEEEFKEYYKYSAQDEGLETKAKVIGSSARRPSEAKSKTDEEAKVLHKSTQEAEQSEVDRDFSSDENMSKKKKKLKKKKPKPKKKKSVIVVDQSRSRKKKSVIAMDQSRKKKSVIVEDQSREKNSGIAVDQSRSRKKSVIVEDQSREKKSVTVVDQSPDETSPTPVTDTETVKLDDEGAGTERRTTASETEETHPEDEEGTDTKVKRSRRRRRRRRKKNYKKPWNNLF